MQKGGAVVQERFIHGEIYKVRPDVVAVVHAHSAELIPFSVMWILGFCPIFSSRCLHRGRGTSLRELRTVREPNDKSMLIHTPALGRALAHSLGDHPAVLIRGHGGAIVGSSLGQAVGRSVYLQQNAAIQRESMSLGVNINYLNAEEARAMGDNTYYRDWEAWRRQDKGRCRE